MFDKYHSYTSLPISLYENICFDSTKNSIKSSFRFENLLTLKR
jgi:hypothetical protein